MKIIKNLFSDWEFFQSNWEKIVYFVLVQGPMRYTEKIPVTL